jgi:hypothetical protein
MALARKKRVARTEKEWREQRAAGVFDSGQKAMVIKATFPIPVAAAPAFTEKSDGGNNGSLCLGGKWGQVSSCV